MTTAEAIQLLSELDGVDYIYQRGINGMVLVHTGDDGYSRETPVNDLRVYLYQRFGIDIDAAAE